MKNVVFVVLAVLGFSLASNSFAQDKKYELYGGLGFGTPLSPESFTDPYKMGFGLNIGGDYFLSPQLTVGTELSFNAFGLDEEGLSKQFEFDEEDEVSISGGDFSDFEFLATAKYYFQPLQQSTNFYGLGGLGFANSRISDITFESPIYGKITSESESSTDLMMSLGVGVRRQLNAKLNLLVEARYNFIFADDNPTYLPVRVSLMF